MGSPPWKRCIARPKNEGPPHVREPSQTRAAGASAPGTDQAAFFLQPQAPFSHEQAAPLPSLHSQGFFSSAAAKVAAFFLQAQAPFSHEQAAPLPSLHSQGFFSSAAAKDAFFLQAHLPFSQEQSLPCVQSQPFGSSAAAFFSGAAAAALSAGFAESFFSALSALEDFFWQSQPFSPAYAGAATVRAKAPRVASARLRMKLFMSFAPFWYPSRNREGDSLGGGPSPCQGTGRALARR